MNQKITDKLDEFVQKVRSREWIIDKSAENISVNTRYNLATNLTRDLGITMTEYETTNENSRSYEDIIQHFNKIINLALTHGVIKEGMSLNTELNDFKNKYATSEIQLKEKISTIQQLQNENSALKERIRIHTAMYPDLKRLDVQESEVTDERSN